MRSEALRIAEMVHYQRYGEAILVLRSDRSDTEANYYKLDLTSGRILELIDQLGSLQAVGSQLQSEYEVSAEQLDQELGAFVEELLKEGILELSAPEE